SCVWIRRACYESNGQKWRSCMRRVLRGWRVWWRSGRESTLRSGADSRWRPRDFVETPTRSGGVSNGSEP
ncbi:unnamed protein product, partial [Ascophyllum nodosum]